MRRLMACEGGCFVGILPAQSTESNRRSRGHPMNRKIFFEATFILASCILQAGCGAKGDTDPAAGAPPPTVVKQEADANVVNVAHPEQFPLAVAVEHRS